MYILLILPLAYAIVFLYGPLYGLQIAFKNFSIVKGITGSPWNGLTNVKLFLGSYLFWPVLKNTLVLALYELLALFPLPIVLALLLNIVRGSRYRRVVQLITFAPHFAPAKNASRKWRWLRHRIATPSPAWSPRAIQPLAIALAWASSSA